MIGKCSRQRERVFYSVYSETRFLLAPLIRNKLPHEVETKHFLTVQAEPCCDLLKHLSSDQRILRR